MRERPILFSAPMVRAILDGRKSQTRRVAKGAERFDAIEPSVRYAGEFQPWRDGQPEPSILCPYGAPGDRLWVRETWGLNHFEYCRPKPIPKSRPSDLRDDQLVYFATEDDSEILAEMPRAPAIHMPRWLSRITLEITEVRAERLNDISRSDAATEGLVRLLASGRYAIAKGDQYFGGASHDPREVFGWLWESINGEGSWAANPWVWVVAFRHVAQEARAA